MDSTQRIIAACGLDCTDCEIRNAPCDPAAADRLVQWFHKMGWLKENEGMAEVIERKMYCKGCKGDRAVHWSADCWILQCCVDAKGLSFCSECADFPCGRLVEWSKQSSDYARAFHRLELMRNRGLPMD